MPYVTESHSEEHGVALLAEHLSRMWRPGALDRPKPSIQFCVSIAFCKQIRNSEFSWKRSVQFSCSVVSDSLRPHEPQHTRPPCPSPTPRVYPNPCPLSQWCHPTILSSVVPFSSCPQSFPVSEKLKRISDIWFLYPHVQLAEAK